MRKTISCLLALCILFTQLCCLVGVNAEDGAEEVLYEVDFSKVNSLDELKEEGWVFLNGSTCYSIADGKFRFGNNSTAMARVLLPKELGEYGDYSITVDAKMVSSANNSRWFSIVYRAKTDSPYYPFYQMCVRDNVSASNGIEFAERTPGNAWNVALTKSADFGSSKDDFHKYQVSVFNRTAEYTIDGETVIFAGESTVGGSTGLYKTGLIGLNADCCVIEIKSIKVTKLNQAPVRKTTKKVKLTVVDHPETNLINPIANVQKLDGETVTAGMGEVLVDFAKLSDPAAFLQSCLENQVLPVFKIDTEEQAQALNSAMSEAKSVDTAVISDNVAVLQYLQKKMKKYSCAGGLLYPELKANMTSKDADAVRDTVRSCPATFLVTSLKNCTKENVMAIQKMAVAVWVDISGEEDFELAAAKALTAGVNGIISKDAAALNNFINANFEKDTMTRTPLNIGHRGSLNEAPENSISSYKAAAEHGADVVETDVYLTKDKQVIIMHDGSIARTTTYTGSQTVQNMTLEEIKKYTFKNSTEKVPTFEEMLKALKNDDVMIFIELKEYTQELCQAVMDLVEKYDFGDRVDIITFGDSAITSMHKVDPGMSCGYLMSFTGDNVDMYDALDALYNPIKNAQSVGATVNPSNGPITRNFIQAATDRGMTVWPWTYDRNSNNYAFFVCSDGITNNDPQWFKDMLKFVKTEAPASVEADGKITVKFNGTTYGGKTEKLSDADKLVIKVIEGAEHISVNGLTVSGVSEGKASLLVGYRTQTADGADYVLYGEPVTLTVTPNGKTVDDNGEIVDKPSGCGNVLFSGAAVLTLLAGAVLLRKKH